jgi:transposase
MGKAISTDLRLRLVRGVERGHSRRAVAAQFEVSPATAVRVQKRYEETGSVMPSRQGRPKNSGKLAPYSGFLIAAVAAQPDITMPALAARLEAAHGVTVDPSNISKFLRRLGFSYKKNPAGLGTRAR